MIFIALALLVTGQLAGRAGAQQAAAGSLVNPFLLASYGCFLLRGLLWVVVLRTRHLVYAYPILALTYPLVLILSALVFGEAVTPGRVAGSALIVIGVSLISHSEQLRGGKDRSEVSRLGGGAV